MHYSLRNSLGHPFFQRETVVIENCPIGVDTPPVRLKNENMRRHELDELPELLFALSKPFFPAAQILVQRLKLSGCIVESSSKVGEFILSRHADLMLKFTARQGPGACQQAFERTRDASGDDHAEGPGKQQSYQAGDWHDPEHAPLRSLDVYDSLRSFAGDVAINILD